MITRDYRDGRRNGLGVLTASPAAPAASPVLARDQGGAAGARVSAWLARSPAEPDKCGGGEGTFFTEQWRGRAGAARPLGTPIALLNPHTPPFRGDLR